MGFFCFGIERCRHLAKHLRLFIPIMDEGGLGILHQHAGGLLEAGTDADFE